MTETFEAPVLRPGHVFVVEYIEPEKTALAGVAQTWDAAVYAAWSAHPDCPDHEREFTPQGPLHKPTPANPRMLVPSPTSDPYTAEARVWETTGEFAFIRVTAQRVRTQAEDRFEVRTKHMLLGEPFDGVVRDWDGISNRAHAEALAAGWNENPLDEGATYYVRQVFE